MAMTRVTLRPAVSYAGRRPTPEEHARLHEDAHGKCYIANSVTTEIALEPRIA
jgi:organic hydroperoxide reductase OsmC/OhrA